MVCVVVSNSYDTTWSLWPETTPANLCNVCTCADIWPLCSEGPRLEFPRCWLKFLPYLIQRLFQMVIILLNVRAVTFFFKVRQVIWSQDDSKIISCGMDGAVYEWNVTSYKREGESVLKSCSYTGVSVSPDSRTTFAVGSDRTLKEICDSQVGF